MKFIVALGNPGTKYQQTRHNAGFSALDFFIENSELKIVNSLNNFQSEIFETKFKEEKILLVKPKTFMNESGQAVSEICNFYKIDISKELLVIHDEVDLPLGTIRTTPSSTAAGHNGITNIIDKLSTQDFHRIRIGIESRASRDSLPTDAFVLQNFSPEELHKLREEIFPKVKSEIENFLEKKI